METINPNQDAINQIVASHDNAMTNSLLKCTGIKPHAVKLAPHCPLRGTCARYAPGNHHQTILEAGFSENAEIGCKLYINEEKHRTQPSTRI